MERGLCARLRENIARLGAVTQSVEDQEILQQISRDFDELAIELSSIHRDQRALDQRLEKIEQSLLFRIVRWPGVNYAHLRNLMDRWLERSDSQYGQWLTYEQRSLFPGQKECLKRIAAFTKQPLFTIALAARECRPDWLRETIQSVAGQIYCSWELSICVDGTMDPATLDYLDEFSGLGSPVRVVRHASPKGIPAALNAACALSNGEYIGFLDQHDVLSPYALFYVAEALQKFSPALLYSDEDALSAEGRRVEPLFKPAWSPDLLSSKMYPAHFLVTSSAAFREVGGFRAACDGSQNFDLCLRITERDERVVHIPRILYHRRKDAAAAASTRGEEESQVHSSDLRAIEDAIQRRNWSAEIAEGVSPHTFRIKRATHRLVSIVICTRSPKLLGTALAAIRRATSYPAYEIIVAEDCPEGPNPEISRLATLFGCRRVALDGPFNFSSVNNTASEQAKGDVLLFLNDDIEPLRADWLSNLIPHLEVEEIGIVGAKLLYPSGAIQHAGVAVGIGDGAGHVNRYKHTGVYWKWVNETRNVSVVTGACLAVRTELFRRLGGFDVAYPNNYNDVDFCLRAREAGYRVVYEPAAVLRHYEGQTRTLHVDYDERVRFYTRWHRIIESGDPYYNPNLAVEEEGALLNFKAGRQKFEARMVR